MAWSVGILVVSDTAAADGGSSDLTGPILAEHFGTAGAESFVVAERAVVPDDRDAIAAKVIEWADERDLKLVITAGGTGFGIRDCTPEAIAPLLQRDAPGIVHAMLSSSLSVTPFAALARPVAGVRLPSTLVITLPGSPKAARENLSAVFGILGHSLDLLSGGGGEKIHKALGALSPEERRVKTDAQSSAGGGGGHSCSHHASHDHRHHGPKSKPAGVASRHRISPFPIISLDEAFHRFLECTPRLGIENRRVDPALRGYALAEDITASLSVPSRPSTNVDGYAVVAPLQPGTFPVVTSTCHPLNTPLPLRTLYRINTGAPLPSGANSVIMVEDTELASTSDASGNVEEATVSVLEPYIENENVRSAGSDVQAGEQVLSRGQIVGTNGGEIGTLAFVGRGEVEVYRKPRVAVVSTGNELVDLHGPKTPLSPDDGEKWTGIVDSNRPALLSALASNGFESSDEGILSDSLSATATTLRRLVDIYDVVITSGGTSMGEGDFLKPVLEGELGGQIIFGRIAVKPGKPTTFATVPRSRGDTNCLVWALPGNPASCLVTFHVFVLPCLRKMAGYDEKDWHLPRTAVELANRVRLDPRPEFQRATVRTGRSASTSHSGRTVLVAATTGGQRSSRTVSLAGANALLALPAFKPADGTEYLEAGSEVAAILIGPLAAA